ncbi:MAG: molecular chaperone HtpG [Planctomycetes bacterium]|nr:molecular chaperone HtpG [Planctomycetota bacterium]
MTEPNQETDTTTSEHPFQAEVNQVLDIVINSLYSHREVFLRELISNSADALDKIRFQAVTDESLLGSEKDLEIQLVPDKSAGTLTIIDTGIGMTRDEVIQNLGTIAHSGSKGFLAALKEKEQGGESVDLIGQFGVGFYASFLVADKVLVRTLAAGDDQTAWRWESEAKGTFHVEPAPEWTTRGTEVKLFLKDDQKDVLEEYQIRQLVQRYSDFVSWPILLEVEREEGEDDDKKTVKKDERINNASALWRRPRREITDEEYEEFYKHVSRDREPPLDTIHFTIEGTTSYTGLIYLPKKAPFDLFDQDKKRGVRLYVKRVMIMEDCEDLVPEYLRFLRGVIDSDDLPLNVSRELLQEDRIVRSIKKTIVTKTLGALEFMAKERADDYAAFWDGFGVVLKEGLHFDFENKETLAKLVRYRSSKSDFTSLTDYVDRMSEDQDTIYYAIGQNRQTVEGSPHIEALKKKDIEVLYMTDPIDEWAVQGLDEFDGKKLASAMKSDLDLDKDRTDEQKAEDDANQERLEDLSERAQKVLEDRVSEVRVSRRLDESPCCLVVPDGGVHAHIERMLRAQGQDLPAQKRILELNPTHPVIERLHLLNANPSESDKVENWFELLYDQALLAEGSPIADPPRFAKRMSDLMTQALESEEEA